MRFTLVPIFLATGLLLAGCDPGQFAVGNGSKGDLLLAEEVTITQSALDSPLALHTQDSLIRVGQNLGSSLIGGFRRPEKGVALHELPPQFSSGFRASGWETPERTVSLVGRDDDVVLALETWTGMKAEKREQLFDRYQRLYGTPEHRVEGPAGEYLFWDDGAVRLMICWVPDAQRGSTVTTVVGLSVLMDRLRMNPEAAQRDLAAATELMRAAQETTPAR